MLWGSLFVDQKPNGQHAWHLDVEHGSWDGVTVWIGLKNLSEKTSLSLITHSHLLKTAPLELKKKLNLDNGLFLTIKWYLNNLDWINEIRLNKYNQERLGKL